MRHGALIVLAAACLLCGSPTWPQAIVIGAGGSTCGAMLTAIETYGQRQEIVYQSWAQGYLTALNVGDLAFDSEAERHDLSDWASSWRALEGYCRDNPESGLVAALVIIWRGLPSVTTDDLVRASQQEIPQSSP